jgi:hypothetical protein
LTYKEKNMDNFEYATRNKIRFASSKGALTTEQLWDVPLRSKDEFNLNAVAKVASVALKQAEEDNFVDQDRRLRNDPLSVAFEVVRHVIKIKLEEEEAAKKRVQNRQEKEKLLAILAEKQAGKLSELSESDLQRRIAALEE